MATSVLFSTPKVTSGRRGRRVLDRLGVAGTISAIVVLGFLIVAVLGPVIAPHDPSLGDLSSSYAGPSLGHPLGFDGLGRDLLSRMLSGGRSVAVNSIAVVLFAFAVGVTIGMMQATRQGWFDISLASVNDAILAFPGLLLAILAVAILGSGTTPAIIALSIVYVPLVARLTRAAALTELNRGYTDALRTTGMSRHRVVIRHVLPNVAPALLGLVALVFAWVTLDMAALSFLGLGVQEPTPDWGLMVSSGLQGVLVGFPNEALYAGAALVVVIIAMKILGDRLVGSDGS